MNQDDLFAAHAHWIAGLRAEYEKKCSESEAVPQSTGFGGFGGFNAHSPVPLHERFNDALGFEDEPVYRSMGGVSWQPANDELDFEDEPVYRSLGFAGAIVEEQAMPDAHAAWMQSMPPLVQRQPAFRM